MYALARSTSDVDQEYLIGENVVGGRREDGLTGCRCRQHSIG